MTLSGPGSAHASILRSSPAQTFETQGPAEELLARIRTERDRYVALAFAAGDVLIEIDHDRRIHMVSGACKSLCGRPSGELAGTNVCDLAVPAERAFFDRLLDGLSIMGRIDPVPIRLQHSSGAQPVALLGACQVSTFPDRIFVSLTLMPSVDRVRPRDEATGLLTREGIVDAAKAASVDMSGVLPRQLSLIRMDGLGSASRELPRQDAESLMQEIGATLRAMSLGGDTAGRLGEDEFGLVRGPGQKLENLPDVLDGIARQSGLRPGAFTTAIADLDLCVGQLTETEAGRALGYVLKRFSESRGGDFGLSSISSGLPAAIERTAARVSSLGQMIERGELKLVFQPIVNMSSRELHHCEVLTRFPDGRDPFETITFSEEVGLIEELDLSVCHKALRELEGTRLHRLAVNVSGRSVQNAAFRSSLERLVQQHQHVARRLIFELTESSAVEEMETAGNFLQWLRTQGHKVCLDDFGSGAAAYGYLRHFDVDFVKIDGPFLRSAFHRQRDRALIASVCRLCADLNTETIGEMIETEAEARAAAELGIGFGQGWHFGRPSSALPLETPPSEDSPGGWQAIRRGTR